MDQPNLVQALNGLFDMFWVRGTPLSFAEPESDQDDADGTPPPDVVDLLALGLTDATTLRMLGVSERTVYRRFTALMESLNVRKRFELGMQVGRQRNTTAGPA